MLTLVDLFKHYGLIPDEIKLVRHGTEKTVEKNISNPSILEIFQTKREQFCDYQSFQPPKKFDKAKHIAAFARTRGTTALFLGIWNINGQLPFRNFDEQLLCRFADWKKKYGWTDDMVCYNLIANPKMEELSRRLVIDWGNAPLVWVQNGSTDKYILEIKAPHSIREFLSYDQVCLSFTDLKTLIEQSTFNPSWVSALSAVNGVYLIRDKFTGKLYVGSAYGKGGIFGRWEKYAKTGHGDNQRLKDLDHNHFEFSILEIAPSTASEKEVIDRENRWKERLGSREFGLNCN